MSNISALIKVCKIKKLPQEVEDLIFSFLEETTEFKKLFLINPYDFNFEGDKNFKRYYHPKYCQKLSNDHNNFLINIFNEMVLKGLKVFTNKGVINILYKTTIDAKYYWYLKQSEKLRNLFYENKTIEY